MGVTTVRTRLPIRATAWVALLWPALAGAEESPRPPDTPPRFEAMVEVQAEVTAEPPPSTVATRLPVAVKDLPLSVAEVGRATLDEQGARVLGDALPNVSGVNVGTGFGVFDFFVVRGFDSLTGGLVLTDGLPEPESTFYPLYNVRQVEVLKGPASFLHGGNPLSGAVQLARKQPQAKRFVDAALGYGRFGTFDAAVDANAATSDGQLAARLNATWQGTDSYRDLADGSIKAVNPTLSWRPDEKTRLLVDYERVRSEWPPDTGIPFVGESGAALAPVPRTRSYQTPYDASTQDVERVRLEAERRFGDTLVLRNRLYYTELAWDSDGTLVNGAFPFPDGRTYVARTMVLLDDRQQLLGNQLELGASFDTGSLHHDLLAGFDVRSFEDRFTQDVAFLPPIDLLEPVETAQPPFATVPALGQRGDSSALVLAPYLVDRVRVTSRLSAFLGARLDVLDYEDPENATEREDTRLNPMLGLSFSATRDLSLFASWGTATAPPSTQVVGPREPEESEQVELGAKLALPGGKAFASLALYHLDREGIAIPDSTGFSRQVGDQRSRGVELDLSVHPGPGWVATAAYAYTDAELTRFAEIVPLQPPDFVVVDRSGNRAPFAPRHLLSLWTSKHFGNGIGVALGLRAASEQFVAEDNRYAIEGYATLDAMLSYERGPARLRVNLRNLTGTEYETRGFGAVSAIPARPFEASARLELGFGRR
jgi:iron complex outermembrane receptor protein